MPGIVIRGGNRLRGEVGVCGAKNSVLPILAASFAVGGICEIHNCPKLSDVDAACAILRHLGCKAQWQDGGVVTVDSREASGYDIPESLMREMRSSIAFLGPIMARVGKTEISHPGGCELGPRPIDLHLSGLSRMGASIEIRGGSIMCNAGSGLKGRSISLSFPSVGATENLMSAAVTAEGITVIANAAREPEIVDMASFLTACGAKITGAGCSTITIEGVKKLHGCTYKVIPDRIEAATFMTAAAITGGDVRVCDINSAHLLPVLSPLEEMGCEMKASPGEIRIKGPERLKAVKHIRTMPYPGFPTDCQAIFMSAAAVAAGSSIFIEDIFDCRWGHIGELRRMGASITIDGRIAVVEGVKRLYGAAVDSTDLRGGAALVVAGLAAEGETTVKSTVHIDRGYCELEEKLCALGGVVHRI